MLKVWRAGVVRPTVGGPEKVEPVVSTLAAASHNRKETNRMAHLQLEASTSVRPTPGSAAPTPRPAARHQKPARATLV